MLSLLEHGGWDFRRPYRLLHCLPFWETLTKSPLCLSFVGIITLRTPQNDGRVRVVKTPVDGSSARTTTTIRPHPPTVTRGGDQYCRSGR